MKARTYRMVMAVLVLLIMATLSFSAVSAQDTTAEIEVMVRDLVYDFEVPPYTCLGFTLEIDGAQGDEFLVAAYPVFGSNDTLIWSVAPDPRSTTDAGEIVAWATVTSDYESSLWDLSEGNGVWLCTNDWDFPLPAGEATTDGQPSYDFYYLLEITNISTGQTWNTHTADDPGYIRYTRNPTEVRVSGMQFDLEASYEGQPGSMAYFTVELFGYQGADIRVALFVRDAATDELVMARKGDSLYTGPNGEITSQDVVSVGYEHTLWSPVLEDGDFFHLFLPDAVFPQADLTWYPEINIWDENTGELLLSWAFYDTEVTFTWGG